MSEKQKNGESKSKEKGRKISIVAKRLAALSTAVAVGGAGTYAATSHDSASKESVASLKQENDRLAGILAGIAEVKTETIRGTSLRSPSELGGFGKEVDPATAESLKKSTVQILGRDKLHPGAPIPNQWYPNCTGLKVEVDGQTYVATASHCLPLEGQKGGFPGSGTSATNVTDVMSRELAVQMVGSDGKGSGDIVPIEAAAMDLYNDWAILKPAESEPGNTFHDTPAIDYEKAITFTAPEEVAEMSGYYDSSLGQSAVVYGLPGASGNRVVMGTGIYVGTTLDPNSRRVQMYIGLTNADSPDQDACNFGASGSSAMLADGKLTGPLAMRYNSHYQTGSEPSDPSAETRTVNMLKLEEGLGVDLGQFDTVCGYSISDTQLLHNLVDSAENRTPNVTHYSPYK